MQLVQPDDSNYCRAIAFSPDGKTLAASPMPHYLQVWDIPSGRPLAPARRFGRREGASAIATNQIPKIAFSRDSKLMATAGDDHTVRLWDTRTMTQLHVFRGHSHNLFAVTFSPDGGMLASGGWDGQIKLWDIATREERLTLGGSSRNLQVYNLAFSRNGEALLAGGWGELLLFRATRTTSEAPQAQPVAPRIWHREQAEKAVAEGQGYAARFHLDPLLELAPKDSKLLMLRLQTHLGEKEWQKARELADRLAEVGSVDEWDVGTSLVLPRLYLQCGDPARYRKASAKLFQRLAHTNDIPIADQVAWSCVLHRDSGADPLKVLELATSAVSREPNIYAYSRTLGAALIRAGKFEQAVERLKKAVKLQETSPTAWLLLAHACQKSGHAAEARTWLEKAVRWHDQAVREAANSPQAIWNALPWYERLAVELLRREAEQVVNKAGK